jgi:hypothetical protein
METPIRSLAGALPAGRVPSVFVEFELRWPPEDGEIVDGGTYDISSPVGVSPGELAELRDLLPSGATIETRTSSMGKGASGPALAVVVTVERIVNDGASLIAVGAALHQVIAKLRRKRTRTPLAEDHTTMAALGAADAGDRVVGMRYLHTVPLLASLGMGTDERDVWGAVFVSTERDGEGMLLLLSPSGKCLGFVPLEADLYWDGKEWRRRATPSE